MSDQLGDLKNLLRQTPEVIPDRVAKNQAIDKAMAEFDRSVSSISQGSRLLIRLKDAVRAAWQTILGSKPMKSYRYITTGAFGAALTVALIGVFLVFSTPYKLQRLLAFTDRWADSGQLEEEAESPGKNVAMHEPAPRQETKQAAPAPSAPVPQQESRVTFNRILPKQEHHVALRQVISSVESQDFRAKYYQDQGRDKFREIKSNPISVTLDEPVSTFSIDVDTASYGFVRASLNRNVLPQKDAVRVEELVNYFPYDYTQPDSQDEPFKVSVSVFPTPWNPETKLMHLGIRGYQIERKQKPRSNLVFLIDTSGSMHAPNKLPLVQTSLKMLLDTLEEEDSVAIVTYAGHAGTALEPTKVKEKAKIVSVIDNLAAGGSTAGAEGIRQAYQLAGRNFDKKGINRVILATDGDFNVGITNLTELKSFIERQRDTGVYLSVLGYGMGNYNDQLMQVLAQNGNGTAAYIDTLHEARKALVEEAGATLFPIAKDVKIQVEFNPKMVAEYRLIGYETRLLNREDFNNDRIDAGEVGSGHTVTALYEMTPVDSKDRLVDELRYQRKSKGEPAGRGQADEYAFVKIRYKLPNSDNSKLMSTPVGAKQAYQTLEAASAESRFAVAVAAFGQLLRGDPYVKRYGYDDAIALAEGARGQDKFGYRAEFINLMRIAKHAPALPAQAR